MSLKFLSKNLVWGSKLSSSTTNAQYSLSNIKDYRRTKVFRSTQNSDYMVIDFGKSESVDAFAIVDNSLEGWGINSLTLQANETNEWGSPAYSTSVTLNTNFGVAVKEFTVKKYRFWRLVLTSTLGYCEVSNIFLGLKDEITTNDVGYNWSYTQRDLSSISFNRYGQQFSDVITTQKEIDNLAYQVMNKDEIDVILELYDTNRLTRPFFIYFDLESGSVFNDDDRFNGMYYFKDAPAFTNITSGYYNVSMSLREAK